jgi:nicotinamidase-related amidase
MRLVAAETAVLGLHWQVNVVRPEGVFGARYAAEVARAGVIARALEVHAAARRAGMLVVYTRFTVPVDGGQLVRNTPVMMQVADDPALRPEAPGSQLVPELASEPADLVVDNQKLSGLAGSELPRTLAERGIDTLVLTGVATNLTVEQTARHGTDLGFRVWVLADCCVADDPDVHRASLANLELTTMGVVDSRWFAAALAG